jgi:hypothetical protein
MKRNEVIVIIVIVFIVLVGLVGFFKFVIHSQRQAEQRRAAQEQQRLMDEQAQEQADEIAEKQAKDEKFLQSEIKKIGEQTFGSKLVDFNLTYKGGNKYKATFVEQQEGWFQADVKINETPNDWGGSTLISAVVTNVIVDPPIEATQAQTNNLDSGLRNYIWDQIESAYAFEIQSLNPINEAKDEYKTTFKAKADFRVEIELSYEEQKAVMSTNKQVFLITRSEAREIETKLYRQKYPEFFLPPTQLSQEQTATATKTETSSQGWNGHDWNLASESEKRSLCERFASRSAKGNSADFFYDALNAFYDTSDSGILATPCSDIAALSESASNN